MVMCHKEEKYRNEYQLNRHHQGRMAEHQVEQWIQFCEYRGLPQHHDCKDEIQVAEYGCEQGQEQIGCIRFIASHKSPLHIPSIPNPFFREVV